MDAIIKLIGEKCDNDFDTFVHFMNKIKKLDPINLVVLVDRERYDNMSSQKRNNMIWGFDYELTFWSHFAIEAKPDSKPDSKLYIEVGGNWYYIFSQTFEFKNDRYFSFTRYEYYLVENLRIKDPKAIIINCWPEKWFKFIKEKYKIVKFLLKRNHNINILDIYNHLKGEKRVFYVEMKMPKYELIFRENDNDYYLVNGLMFE